MPSSYYYQRGVAFANGVFARAGTIPLRWLVGVFTVAQLLDLVSALVVAREMNPIVAGMVEQPAPPAQDPPPRCWLARWRCWRSCSGR